MPAGRKHQTAESSNKVDRYWPKADQTDNHKKTRLEAGFSVTGGEGGISSRFLRSPLRARLAALGLVQICSCKFVEPSGASRQRSTS